ncbi:winged helix DNA-binding domain-containing protein [Micromonospora sp. WMMD1120]|uniref:winged helix DNA-binding domain-containing protein n=1 Tax=Micromonospora sp. WMMD1120 TaxID=3016106 RepID=UPI00241608F8|nr:winged helix DNA-binding domain-containing protein [Micromonospora sp. WMMD1120]MDG4810698.1 winged helix DNA-binding domain-containing protein [Micromonospora sp. WMMD1120]
MPGTVPAGGNPPTVTSTDLTAAAHALLADGAPRSMAEIGRALAERWPSSAPQALGELAVALVPMAQLPPRGLWRAKGGARYAPLEAWLGRRIAPSTAEGVDEVGQLLVRRYLAAFGPAATADLRAWCGLAGLPTAVTAMRDELVVFRDERGRKLLDLADAPRPDPETPAPVRFLPAFDNAILGYDDRSRIIDDAHRLLSVAGERVLLVDGRVAATWSVESGTVTVRPLRALTRVEHAAVVAEGHALSSFLSDAESDRVRVDPSPR